MKKYQKKYDSLKSDQAAAYNNKGGSRVCPSRHLKIGKCKGFMTTIDPYTIYSIPFFNFVQILTQIFVKKMRQPFRPGCHYLHIKEVYLQGNFAHNTLQKSL